MMQGILEFRSAVIPTALGWAALVLVLSGVYCFYPGLRDGVDLFFLVMGPFIIAMGSYYAVAFLRRNVPVVRLSDERLDFRSPIPFRSHGSVSLRDVERVEVRERALRLSTAGGDVDVPWVELTEEDRATLREEIERRVGA